jgi:N-methylhydantoinase A
VFRRRELARSQIVPGPAIIEQEDSTTWILPGWVGVVDRMGNLIISQVL